MRFSVSVSPIHTTELALMFWRNINIGKQGPGSFSCAIFFSTFSRLLSCSHTLLRTCLRFRLLESHWRSKLESCPWVLVTPLIPQSRPHIHSWLKASGALPWPSHLAQVLCCNYPYHFSNLIMLLVSVFCPLGVAV